MEAIDGTVTSVNQIGTITGLPTLGFVPRYASMTGVTNGRLGMARSKLLTGGNGSGTTSTDPSRKRMIVEKDVMASECFRAIRTAVLLAARQNRQSQVIAVSSPLPGEGKTTTAMNLSLVLAQQGSRVLLVDADMRRPSIEKELKVGAGSRQGLSTALMFGSSDGMITHLPTHNNLYFLPSGAQPQYPADLLGSPAMLMLLEKWRREYDFVIVDLPPILLVTDTAVLAPAMDGIVLVARHGITSRDALQRASALLSDSGGNILGVLLNAIDQSSDNYYGYYGHNTYFRTESIGSRS
jgi:capsular exopolysaccharide synthesis family protein